jgi:hypothetical protein
MPLPNRKRYVNNVCTLLHGKLEVLPVAGVGVDKGLTVCNILFPDEQSIGLKFQTSLLLMRKRARRSNLDRLRVLNYRRT